MKKRFAKTRSGLTLIELMLALTILTMIGSAVAGLLFASLSVNRYATDEGSAVWDADFAWHRIYANAMAAIPAASGGMTPTATTDPHGTSRLTFIVPDIANNTTRTLQYYCTGNKAPFTLVEDDSRYNNGGSPNPIAYNVESFTVTLDSSSSMDIWVDLKLTPKSGWRVRRHFCVNARNF